jgi:hypothetical protein
MPDGRDERRERIVSAERELSDLQRASAQLKARIVEARIRHDMPVDPTLDDRRRDQNGLDGRNDDSHSPSL